MTSDVKGDKPETTRVGHGNVAELPTSGRPRSRVNGVRLPDCVPPRKIRLGICDSKMKDSQRLRVLENLYVRFLP